MKLASKSSLFAVSFFSLAALSLYGCGGGSAPVTANTSDTEALCTTILNCSAGGDLSGLTGVLVGSTGGGTSAGGSTGGTTGGTTTGGTTTGGGTSGGGTTGGTSGGGTTGGTSGGGTTGGTSGGGTTGGTSGGGTTGGTSGGGTSGGGTTGGTSGGATTGGSVGGTTSGGSTGGGGGGSTLPNWPAPNSGPWIRLQTLEKKVAVIRPDGSGLKICFDDFGWGGSFSPDYTKYVSRTADSYARITRNDGSSTLITKVQLNTPSFASDGSTITFIAKDGKGIYTYYEPTGALQKVYTAPPNVLVTDPVMSPDRTKLTFTYGVTTGSFKPVYIAILNLGASVPKLVGPAVSGNFFPSWTPDGESIVYMSVDQLQGGFVGRRHVVSTGQDTQIPGVTRISGITMSPTGNEIITMGPARNGANQPLISRFPISGGSPVVITNQLALTTNMPNY